MLGKFTYCNPTRVHFGEDAIKNLQNELANYGQNVLLVYGGGSIKKNGIYDKVINILRICGKKVFEDGGVMPNPTMEKLYGGIEIARNNNIEFILAVGGGSVVDYAKALSVSVKCAQDPWQKYFDKFEDVDCEIIPMGCILTMVGTGSEMNGGSVITNTKTNQKVGHVFGYNVFPKFAILDPTYTYTLPKEQMVAGIYDIMSHILEQYLSDEDDNTSDYIAEGLLKSLIHSSKVALKTPMDYQARSNIMWTATWALNTLIAQGKSTDWMVHMLGQAIGAYTNATHGMTLAAVTMAYYKTILPYGLQKFVRYAKNIWNVSAQGKSDMEIALEGLNEMEKYMRELGLVMNISELGAKEDDIEKYADTTPIFEGGYKILTKKEIMDVFRQSL